MPSPNWSRPLPRALVIPEVMELVTLADVRELIERRLPAHFRGKATWRVVAKDLKAAALGAEAAEFRSRCGSHCQWKVSNASRNDGPPLPAAMVD